jgi:hypothetical protein
MEKLASRIKASGNQVAIVGNIIIERELTGWDNAVLKLYDGSGKGEVIETFYVDEKKQIYYRDDINKEHGIEMMTEEMEYYRGEHVKRSLHFGYYDWVSERKITYSSGWLWGSYMEVTSFGSDNLVYFAPSEKDGTQRIFEIKTYRHSDKIKRIEALEYKWDKQGLAEGASFNATFDWQSKVGITVAHNRLYLVNSNIRDWESDKEYILAYRMASVKEGEWRVNKKLVHVTSVEELKKVDESIKNIIGHYRKLEFV